MFIRILLHFHEFIKFCFNLQNGENDKLAKVVYDINQNLVKKQYLDKNGTKLKPYAPDAETAHNTNSETNDTNMVDKSYESSDPIL